MSKNPKIYIETYGCQMNVLDSEVVASIMKDNGYNITESINNADIILINTCSVRDNAEQRVWGRLNVFRQIKKKKPEIIIGVIGCMAERLKDELLEREKMVDLVIGPDAYRNLPNLLQVAGAGQKAINVLLSNEELYADINPVRLDKNKVSAFVSIMRGCNNMCAYCVVPYTRGDERSRDLDTIIRETENLVSSGYKEVTLLGQNVNSYHFEKDGTIINFAILLEKVARISPELRVRFSTSHPKDLPDEVLYVMAAYKNICDHIHLPVQSGSTRILELMNRNYTREKYLARIASIKRILPDAALSTDVIAGFCTETEEDHKQTLSLMKEVGYDFAYMFKYSERPDTSAAKELKDDVPDEIKSRRLTEIIDLQNQLSAKSKQADVGKIFEVLTEGISKKSNQQLFGRTSQNKVVVYPKMNFKPGDYLKVKIIDCTSATLIGDIYEDLD
ncbi:MAG: tRNA (N6-isopentenyl adenosine(37)-C2)-methylthiotransferase MiaB [Bacteroidales bacterium]|nr:tRNA (N6-isopentenyl adenosine(37)-C2)-methylthiotransferase MiaB [Bacteroidales bacterium]